MLSVIALVFVFLNYGMLSIEAQTAEPTAEPGNCLVKNDAVYQIKFSIDGQLLLANWPPHSVRVWNAKTGAIVATLTDDLIDNQESIAFSPDKKYVITGGNGGVVMLWDAVSGAKIRTFMRDENPSEPMDVDIQNLAVSADGKYIAVLDRAAGTLWSVDAGTKLYEFPITHHGEPDVEFSPDGKTIMIEDRIWDVLTGQLLHEFDRPKIYNVLFSPNGKYILGIEFSSRNFILIDSNTYRAVHTLRISHADPDTAPFAWQFSPDGKYLLATEKHGLVALWDVESGKLLQEFSAATGYGLRAAFLDNQSILVPRPPEDTSDSEHQTIISVRDIKTGVQHPDVILDISLYEMSSLAAIAHDGKYFVISSIPFIDSIVTAWDIQSGKQIRQYC